MKTWTGLLWFSCTVLLILRCNILQVEIILISFCLKSLFVFEDLLGRKPDSWTHSFSVQDRKFMFCSLPPGKHQFLSQMNKDSPWTYKKKWGHFGSKIEALCTWNGSTLGVKWENFWGSTEMTTFYLFVIGFDTISVTWFFKRKNHLKSFF